MGKREIIKITAKLQQWLGFTRRERRASLTLIILIAIVFCIRFLIPDNKASSNYVPIEQALINGDSVKNASTETAAMSYQPSRTPATRPAMIDINRCDSAQLLPLPGIGAVLSGRIIRFRNLL